MISAAGATDGSETLLPLAAARRVARWFVSDEAALANALASARLRACVHCHRVGMLIGHGRLVGYAEGSSDREVRGRRLLCSNRHRRAGCGRTSPIWLAAVIPRRIVRAATAFALLAALAVGTRVACAWPRISSMALRTGYRTEARLALAGPAIRTALLTRAPPPPVQTASPDAQLVAHLRAVLGPDPFASYQLVFQRPLLG